MNIKVKLLVATIVTIICTLFIAPQAQAILNGPVNSMTSLRRQMIRPQSGPEADPYLRHCPGCYDFENELPTGNAIP